MKKVLKLLFVLFITLSMIKPSFVNADTASLDVNINVKLTGSNGIVEMKPWSGELKNNKYSNDGPSPSPSIVNLNDGNDYDFVISFDSVGNYVYEIRQIKDSNTSIKYDVDIDENGTKDKIYRYYITVVYNEDQSGLVAYQEAEVCYDNKCILNNTTPEETVPIDEQQSTEVPTDFVDKPDSVEFENCIYYWVHYENGDHGTSDKLGNEDNISSKEIYTYKGVSRDTDKPNTVSPSSGYKFAGKYTYQYFDAYGNPMLNSSGDPIMGIITEDDLRTLGLEVFGNIILTPIYEPIPTPPGPKWIQPITGIIAQNPVLYGGVFMGSLVILFLFIKRNKDEKE